MDCEWIGWCSLKPEVQAAWVQAIFSVAAIGAAVMVPWWQHRKAAQLRAEVTEAQATGRAAAVIGDVRALAGQIEHVQRYIKNDQNYHDLIQVRSPKVPQGLIDQAGLLPELGSAGTSLLRAIGRCWEARQLVSTDNFVERETFAEFSDHVMHAEAHTKAALDAIRKLLN